MPHLPWDETVPIGSVTDSDLIDELFRELKLQIRERMNDIVVDWTTDPVVLKPTPGVTLPIGGATIFPPHLLFTGGGLGTVAGVSSSFVAVQGDAIFPIPLSEDLGTMTINTISFVVNPAGNPLNWSILECDFPNTSSNVVKSGTATGSAPVVVSAYSHVSDPPLVVNAVKRLTIGFDSIPALWDLFGVKITYSFSYA